MWLFYNSLTQLTRGLIDEPCLCITITEEPLGPSSALILAGRGRGASATVGAAPPRRLATPLTTTPYLRWRGRRPAREPRRSGGCSACRCLRGELTWHRLHVSRSRRKRSGSRTFARPAQSQPGHPTSPWDVNRVTHAVISVHHPPPSPKKTKMAAGGKVRN